MLFLLTLASVMTISPTSFIFCKGKDGFLLIDGRTTRTMDY